jgi:hypothetical protein
MPLKLFTRIGVFSQNDIQVTSGTPNQARSESIIAVNPNDRNNIIAASKKFTDPDAYRFTIGIRVSFDGGDTWQDAKLPTLPEWGNMVDSGHLDASTGMTDPAIVFDDFGNAFMVCEPIKYVPNIQTNVTDIQTIGMFVSKSTDGGLHWSAPVPLHVNDLADDKSWIAADNNPASPHYGNIYVVWGAGSPLRFARSTDHGQSWKGVGNETTGSTLAARTFAPEISVGLDGTVHIVWCPNSDTPKDTIEYMRSVNGGESFEPQRPIVEEVIGLNGNLNKIGDEKFGKWPHFEGATFRVGTLATGCAFGFNPPNENEFSTLDKRVFYAPMNVRPRNFVVAWSDMREGVARIYYRTSSNAGASFDGPRRGQPLLGGQRTDPNQHHFHPQIVSTGNGVIGCAYYEYGPKSGQNLIDVKLSASFDKGATFPYTTTVTDRPWDPQKDAPHSHGDPAVTFIGEYFGLDAHDTGFDVLWTDTRTGVQELFYDRVQTERDETPEKFKGISLEILFGAIGGGEGIGFVNGHIIHIDPRGPVFELGQALIALDAARKISGPAGQVLTKSIYAAIGTIAKLAGQRGKGLTS